MPTTPVTAPGLDEQTLVVGDETFPVYQALSRNTIVFDSTGLPAINVPAGFSKDDMPVGIQMVGLPFDEAKILSLAYAYEERNDNITKFTPPL